MAYFPTKLVLCSSKNVLLLLLADEDKSGRRFVIGIIRDTQNSEVNTQEVREFMLIKIYKTIKNF